MNRRLLGFLLAAVVLVGSLALALRPREADMVTASLQAMPAAEGTFDRVTGPVALNFPADHGAHPDTQTEWWYFTGNLEGPDGERYGFQLTFFRRALVGPDLRQERASAWGADQAYLAHFTLTDARGGSFRAFERLERGAAGLAGAEGQAGLRVWLHDWRVEQTGAGSFRLQAAEEDIRLDLDLVDRKGVVLQGDRGYSQKGPEAGNASVYYSLTRLETRGRLEIGGRALAVSGLSWMDHEYSTSALGAGQVGWDWFSIQLDDGSELMAYTLRRADGAVDSFSQATLITPDGTTRRLGAADFSLQVEDTWRSPASGGVYPAAWTLTIPAEGITLRIRPLIADQELRLSFIYWEGAVEVEGAAGGNPVRGRGYVELTGYAQSLAGRF
jgi:predicted secreted hydrolase